MIWMIPIAVLSAVIVLATPARSEQASLSPDAAWQQIAGVLTEVEDCNDIFVPQTSGGCCFLAETFNQGPIPVCGDRFDRNESSNRPVESAEDSTEASLADLRLQLITADGVQAR